ncbi:Chemotaxis response regulator protein-glutamate methylesterase [anaerobic digester metagenome]|jgi:two-component system chemotaxis response regulator CheY
MPDAHLYRIYSFHLPIWFLKRISRIAWHIFIIRKSKKQIRTFETFMPGILVVDGKPTHRDYLADILTNAGYQVTGKASSGAEAISLFHQNKPDLVTLDLIMPDMNGMDLLKVMKGTSPSVSFLICTSIYHEMIPDLAKRTGAEALFQKPVSASNLLETVSAIMGSPSLQTQ